MKRKVKVKVKNPYPKCSYNTGLRNVYSDEPVWGIDNKWLMFEIKQGNGLPKIDSSMRGKNYEYKNL